MEATAVPAAQAPTVSSPSLATPGPRANLATPRITVLVQEAQKARGETPVSFHSDPDNARSTNDAASGEPLC